MLFVPLSGLGTTSNYRNLLDRLDLSGVVKAPYGEHREARSFERVSLYSRWLRYGDRMVRYLPERVLHQFGRVQTIPILPVQSAPPDINLAEISNRFRRALDYALTPEQLGQRAVHMWRQQRDTSSSFTRCLIHAWFFLTCRYRCRGHRSVMSLMHKLLRRMERLGTYSVAEG